MPNSGAKPSVVFFGSGPVAAASLELLRNDFNIEAVVTKPKPTHHKEAFPVIEVAEKCKIPLHLVSNRTDLSDLVASKPFKSSVGVLIDFGIIVSQDVIDYFPRGIVNSHFSLLPEWRGADPITFSILSGQESTGVSLMLLVAAMDEGPLISFGKYKLPANITTPLLTEHLINLSHKLLKDELPRYLANIDFKPAPQTITGRKTSYSRKLTKSDGLIDWNKPALEIEREIRAFLDWPKSRAHLAGIDLIITQAHATPSVGVDQKPGDITVAPEAHEFGVATSNGTLWINRLKPAGKNEMTAEDFINGHKELLEDASYAAGGT